MQPCTGWVGPSDSLPSPSRCKRPTLEVPPFTFLIQNYPPTPRGVKISKTFLHTRRARNEGVVAPGGGDQRTATFGPGVMTPTAKVPTSNAEIDLLTGYFAAKTVLDEEVSSTSDSALDWCAHLLHVGSGCFDFVGVFTATNPSSIESPRQLSIQDRQQKERTNRRAA